MIGGCWLPVEAVSGLHLLSVPMMVQGWLIAGAMWLPGGKLPWHFGLPAVGVTLVICLLQDLFAGWCVYFAQTGFVEDFSPLTALLLFPAYWHFTHFFAYGLAGIIAYLNSYDRASWKSPPPSDPAETIADYALRMTSLAGKVQQQPKPGLSPYVLAALILAVLLVIASAAFLTRYRPSIREVALSPDGQVLAVVGDDVNGKLIWHDLANKRLIMSQGSAMERITWSRDGKYLAGVHNFGGSKNSQRYAEVVVFQRLGRGAMTGARESSRKFLCLAYSPDGREAAAGCEDGDVLIWTPLRFHEQGRLSNKRAVASLSFSPATGTLAAGLSDGHITLWDPASRQPIRSWQAHDTEVHRVLFAPKEGVLFSAAVRDQFVRAWDPADGSEKQVYSVAMDWIMSLAVAPNGELLAVAGGSFHRPGEVRVFETGSGQLRHVFTVESNTVAAIAFASDGKTLFVGTRPPINPLLGPYQGQVQQWDIITGQQLSPLQ